MSTRAKNRAVAAIAAVVALCGAVVVVRAATTTTPAAAQQDDPRATGRIAFAGTGHRSIGVVTDPVPDRPAVSEPQAEGPAHFEDHVSARGNLVVFTSLRDERRPQVYVRAPNGSVRKLTTGRDAGHPQLSPDLRSVVFDAAEGGQRDLWVVGVDGTGVRRLTDSPRNETWPTFSPDGTQVAFSADRDGEPEVYRQPVAGGAAVRVTDEPEGAAGEPAWNPRDGRIAYTLTVRGEPRLRLLDGDGDGVGAPVLGGDQAGWRGHWPVWKPDGTGLLFLSFDQTCSCPADPNVEKVYQVDTGTGLPVTAAPGLLLAEDRRVSSPAWSVAGPPRLLVSRTTAATRNTATLQDVRPDGADPRDLGLAVLREDPRIAEDPNRLFHPGEGFDPWTQRQSYSPDGRRIVVTRFEDVDGGRAQRLWLVDADGGDPRRLPVADRQPADWEFDPVWSPDGRFVAFARRSPGGVRPDAGGLSRVVVVEVATGAVVGNLRPPTEVPGQEDTQPAWSPDGTTLAFTRGVVFNGPDGVEVRDNHVWTARARTLDRQADVSAAVCGFDCEVTDDSAAFRPDGRTLVFNREFDGLVEVSLPGNGCRVLLPQGQRPCSTPLTAPPTGPFQPRDAAYAPDGERLVLTTRRQGDAASPEELAVLDGSGALDRITRDLPGRQKEPTWQPSVDLAVQAPPAVPEADTGTTTTATVTVTNRGPATSPGTALTVAVPEGVRVDVLRPDRGSCDASALRCDLGALEDGTSVRISVDLVGLVPGRRQLTWSVAGEVLDVRPADNSARTEIPVRDRTTVPPTPPTPSSSSSPPPPPPPPPPPAPAPDAGPGLAVVVQPNPSYVGGRATATYTVRNGGGALATGLRLDFAPPRGVPVAALPPGCSAAGCALPDLAPGAALVVQVVFAPDAPLETTVGGVLRTTGTDADPGDNTANAPMRVLLPRIVAVPPIGEPGFVTSVRGVDFPPGAPVRLTWSPGITATAVPTIPRPDGGFTAQLLILAKDQTGPRTITATGPGFRPATTPFLVVVGSIGPPDMVRRR
ncbi:Tol biopolymer transport system component [Saccharothrix tamanrassetensis]|uniref:Tol biopolymer transport system component n=1 Tax=Saccharothrix tamanrassetensis TaxID=1051531 RepID=A0A841CMW9_9PSEU|nr:DUF11 domain-containing protein [Saccharothrix tamanrassetensis]MBB5958273.1 Tol biopolymer transport system component [Saccharothrix tamanrassetensis]